MGTLAFYFGLALTLFLNLHPALMLGIHEKVMCSLDNEFCLMIFLHLNRVFIIGYA